MSFPLTECENFFPFQLLFFHLLILALMKGENEKREEPNTELESYRKKEHIVGYDDDVMMQ